jgi:hypothetical protein
MELTWAIRLRVAIAAAVGVGIIGIYGWPLVAPADSFGVVSIVNGHIANSSFFVIGLMAFVSGFISYFLTWPYGTRIGILAAPAGLIAWSVRSADMGTLMQLNNSLARREQFYSTFCWEPAIWLAIIAAGCLGVLLGYSIYHPLRPVTHQNKVNQTEKPWKPDIFIHLFGVFLGPIIRDKYFAHQRRLAERDSQKNKPTTLSYLAPPVAVIGSTIVSLFFIGMLARDFIILDTRVGCAIGQPATAQIIFAILVAFGVSGYLVKKVLDLNYYWPIIATCLVIPFGIIIYGQYDVLDYFAGRWPAVFFANSVLSVFPIQVVAFGTIGAVAGYWLAFRYDYWRQVELSQVV